MVWGNVGSTNTFEGQRSRIVVVVWFGFYFILSDTREYQNGGRFNDIDQSLRQYTLHIYIYIYVCIKYTYNVNCDTYLCSPDKTISM